MAPPLELAEQAFHKRPYSTTLFDAAAAYRETLRDTTSIIANNVKRKLNWVLWHDPRRVEKKCCTRRIQLDIHTMPQKKAYARQWLLLNQGLATGSAPGKAWPKEAAKRLKPIGQDEFLQYIDKWFTFPGEVHLSPAGSSVLRLLVWYGSAVDTERSLPLLARVAHVTWVKREPVG